MADVTIKEQPLPCIVVKGPNVKLFKAAMDLAVCLAHQRYYLLNGGLVEFKSSDPDKPTEPVADVRLPSVVQQSAQVFRTRLNKDGDIETLPYTPTVTEIKALIAHLEFADQSNRVTMVSRCPMLVLRDGKPQRIQGYDSHTHILAAGKAPDSLNLNDAVALINDIFRDYDFRTPGDQSRAIAALLTPAMMTGKLIDGRAPINMAYADHPGAGKGFRHKLTCAVYNEVPDTFALGVRGGGFDSLFNGLLLKGQRFISIDDVKGVLSSRRLNSFMTEPVYNIPRGTASVAVDPAVYTIMLTSNDMRITPDLARRSIVVHSYHRGADCRFTRYPEGGILDHIQRNQPRYLGAVFAVLEYWISENRPVTTLAMPSFDRWAGSLDWIVQNVFGLRPLLEDHSETLELMTDPEAAWIRRVSQAITQANLANQEITTTQILDVLIPLRRDIALPSLDLRDHPVFDGSDAAALERLRKRLVQALGIRLGHYLTDKEAVTSNAGVRFECNPRRNPDRRKDDSVYTFDRY